MALEWELLLSLFEGALERPLEERAAFLDERTKGDAELRREIDSLLVSHDKSVQFLGATALAASTLVSFEKGPADRSPTGQARLAAGTSLGVFTILERLGAGGMGEVYRARDPRLDRLVAIKILSPEREGAGDGRDWFEREARAISRLSHPRICTVHDVGVASLGGSDVPFLVMELLDGETLAARMARAPLSSEEALEYAIDIADALVAAHGQGIVHRDLKPANVMLTSTGVKLLDFGLAQLRAPEGAARTAESGRSEPISAGLVFGTRPYASPEQLRGAKVDARGDIFACGAVLYEMLTGSRPFEADSEVGVTGALFAHDPRTVFARRALLPADLEPVVEKCLALHAGNRWQTARDLKSELIRVRKGRNEQRPESATPATRPAGGRDSAAPLSAGRGLTRSRVAFAVLALTAVVGGVLAVRYYRENEHRRQQELRRAAADVFYDLRALQGTLVRLRQGDPSSSDVHEASYRRDKLDETYDRYVTLLGGYQGKSSVEQAVMRMARRFGEVDLDVPPEFHQLTVEYVRRWSSSERFTQSLARARTNDLIHRIRGALDERGLPKELVFVALVESRFSESAVGPQTRFGVPKGMWQFIPATARRYGLVLGPLSGETTFDPLDERHDTQLATRAAARYLADIYSEQAAASGLLAVASFNTGGVGVRDRLAALPNDPRERTFWRFYRNHWLSAETEEYVMLVFAAALISEEPALFGLDARVW